LSHLGIKEEKGKEKLLIEVEGKGGREGRGTIFFRSDLGLASKQSVQKIFLISALIVPREGRKWGEKKCQFLRRKGASQNR